MAEKKVIKKKLRKPPKKKSKFSVLPNTAFDMWAVPKQCESPDKVHFWPRRDPHRVQEMLHRGAVIEKGYEDIPAIEDPTKVVRTPDSLPPSPPEHILMYYPKEIAEARKELKDERAREQEEEVKSRTREAIKAVEKYGGRKGRAMLKDDDIEVDDDSIFEI